MTRLRGFAVALVLLASLGLYATYFNRYTAPNSDYFAFRQLAESYQQFAPPSDYKRLPAFPVLLALGSPLARHAADPFLLTGQVLNLLLSVAGLFLLYRLLARFLPRTAILPLLLFALSSQTVWCTSQPLLEPLLLLTIVGTFALLFRGSRWAYLVAAIGSLTRYEAAVLIPIVFFVDLSRGGSIRWAVARGAVSSLGISVWMALSISASAMVNPYVERIIARGSTGIGFLKAGVGVLLDPVLSGYGGVSDLPAGGLIGLKVAGAATLAGLLAVGAVSLFGERRRACTALLTFLGAYTLIHVVFPLPKPHYLYPVTWIVWLFVFRGVEAILSRWVRPAAPRPLLLGALVLLLLAGLGPGAWALAGPVRTLLLGALCIALVLWAAGAPLRGGAFPVILVLVGVLLARGGICAAQNLMDLPWIRYNRAQDRATGEWLHHVARPGDRILSLRPSIVSYFARLPDEYFVPVRTLAEGSREDFFRQIHEREITYAVWDNQYAGREEEFRGRMYKVGILRHLEEPDPSGVLTLVHEVAISRWRARIYRVAR